MNDGTEVGAKAKGKGAGKKAGTGGAKAEGAAKGKKAGGAGGKPNVEAQICRMLVRAIWAQEWSLANPEGQAEARKAAWKDARDAAMEKNLKPYRRAINTLGRLGVTFGLTEAAAKAKSDEDDGGED